MKIRHSRYAGLWIDEARQALSLVEETADEFTETLRRLSSTADGSAVVRVPGRVVPDA